jgi:hypothetical protein
LTCRIRISEDSELRLLTEEDAKELHRLIEANRAHIAAWLPWGAEQKLSDTLEFIQGTRAQLEGNDGFQVAILIDDRVAGVITWVPPGSACSSGLPVSCHNACRKRADYPGLPGLGPEESRLLSTSSSSTDFCSSSQRVGNVDDACAS